jgi:signal transduction histidine kinase
MGGIIGVESAVGRGSKFWIELNLTTKPQPTYIARTTRPI